MLNYSIELEGCRITTSTGEHVATVTYDARANRPTNKGRWEVMWGMSMFGYIPQRMWSLEAAKYYVLSQWLDAQACSTRNI